jgi:hypothetical protein
MKTLLTLLLTVLPAFGATLSPTPWTPRVFTNYVDMATRADPYNYNQAVYILGGTNSNDGWGGWFRPTNSIVATNLTDKIADSKRAGYSWARLSYNVDQSGTKVPWSAVITTAYDATGWNGNTNPVSADSVRDKIETLGGGGTVGTVINSGTPVNTAVPIYSGTTGTNITPSSVTITSLTNLVVPGTFSVSATAYLASLIVTNSIDVGTAGTAGIITLYDTDADHSGSISPNGVTTTDVNMQLPAAPFNGMVKGSVSSTTNWILSQATAGTDYQGVITVREEDGTPSVSPVTTLRVANGTLTDNGSGSVSISTGAGSGANWAALGTTNSTLAGDAYMYSATVTNMLTVVSNGAPVMLNLGDADDSRWASYAAHPTITTNNVIVSPIQAFADGSVLAVKTVGTLTNSAGTAYESMYLTNMLTTGSGDVVLKTAPTIQNVKLQSSVAFQTAAGTVASSSSISPTTPNIIISGTAAIDTITAPSGISSTGGVLFVMPTGVFTLTTAGNISKASTAEVGRLMILAYDSGTSKWYPSY